MTRLGILAEAKALIAESGNAAISLGDLASRAGIGRTTFYEYFSDRDDVIASLVEEELPGVIDEVISGVTATDTEARLSELINATVFFVVDNPVLGLILHTEVPKLGARAQVRVSAAHADLARETASVYLSGVADGVFRPIDPSLAGRLIQDSIMAAAKTIIGSADPTARAPEIAAELGRFLLAGLSADKSS
ncbi:MAG TPA: TetR/AcrR family transcriptional regulator [Acidimicrobiia bacterium]